MNPRYPMMSLLCVLAALTAARAQTVLLETEAFEQRGGWVLDPQFMDQMGSPYLLAHGLGQPVEDAHTDVDIPTAGSYRLWVRTRDWVWMSRAPGTAGRFQVLVDGTPHPEIFGTEGREWHWQAGGTLELPRGRVRLALHDLTGFEGRCDAILLSREADFAPPEEPAALARLRRELLELPAGPEPAGSYDLVVVGGGTAGISAALAAARLGANVALIQNRPVLGGNNSSEVRVWRGGGINFEPFPRLGDIDREFGPRAKASPGTRFAAGDARKLAVVQAEERIALFLEHHAYAVLTEGQRIVAVDARHIASGRTRRFSADLFADCTGDGTIGYLAGADWEMTLAGHMGPSNMWRIEDTGQPQPFPRCPWAHDLSTAPPEKSLGIWNWESGFGRDPIAEAESIRDNNFRGMYGAWDALKNVHGQYANHAIAWAAFIAGKRESRRLMGDVVLTREDIVSGREWPDPAVPCSWTIDLHYPTAENAQRFGADAFRSHAVHTRFSSPYWLPYRCLFSRKIENLFMAGRCISVTHEALGTARVMRTTGMMGEVVGMAAALARRLDSTPRGIYRDHIAELQALMRRGVGKLPPADQPSLWGGQRPAARGRLAPPPWRAAAGANLARSAAVSVSSLYEDGRYPAHHLNDGAIEIASNERRWVSARTMPQWVELRWKAPITFSALRLVSGWQSGGLRDPIRDFVLQSHDGQRWVDVPGTRAKDNTRVDWHARFAPHTTARLRLLVAASPMDTARLWELELYHPRDAASGRR